MKQDIVRGWVLLTSGLTLKLQLSIKGLGGGGGPPGSSQWEGGRDGVIRRRGTGCPEAVASDLGLEGQGGLDSWRQVGREVPAA